MDIPPENCTLRHFLIDPYQIHYLRFIIEAYPGIGVVSTVDPVLGLVTIAIAPGCENIVDDVLEAERKNLGMRDTCPSPELIIGQEDSQ